MGDHLNFKLTLKDVTKLCGLDNYVVYTQIYAFEQPNSHRVQGALRIRKEVVEVALILLRGSDGKHLVWPAQIRFKLLANVNRKRELLYTKELQWHLDDVEKSTEDVHWRNCFSSSLKQLMENNCIGRDDSVTFHWSLKLSFPPPQGLESATSSEQKIKVNKVESEKEQRIIQSQDDFPDEAAGGAKKLEQKERSGAYSHHATKARTTKSNIARSLSKSADSSIAADLMMDGRLNKSTPELANIEREHTRNLQQQIYFLQLEAKHYSESQARKAAEMHSQMAQEAEKMLVKLRSEIYKMDSTISAQSCEISRLKKVELLEEDNRRREKRLMEEELTTVKNTKERLEIEIAYKNEQLMDAKNELDGNALALKKAEADISTLKVQLQQTKEQLKETTASNDRKTEALRNEIRLLRQQVNIAEQRVKEDRLQRDKVVHDLAKEKEELREQVVQLSRQLERSKDRDREIPNLKTNLWNRDNRIQLQSPSFPSYQERSRISPRVPCS